MLRKDGSVWSTGVDSDYLKSSFVQVIPSGAAAVTTDIYYSLVLKDDGGVTITGKGQLSFFDGSATSRRMFVVL